MPISFFEELDALMKLEDTVNDLWSLIIGVPAKAVHLAFSVNDEDSFLDDLLVQTDPKLEGIVAHSNDRVANASEFFFFHDKFIRLQDQPRNDSSIFSVFNDYDSVRGAVDLVYLCHGAWASKLCDAFFVKRLGLDRISCLHDKS